MVAGVSQGGRPRKSPERRDAIVSCRLTQEEWRYLADRALNEDLALSDLVRALLLADMPAETPATDVPAAEGGSLEQFLAKHPWGR